MNQAILKYLKQNARASWQDIGKRVHLSGQAVATRVQQMEAQGIISGYTIRQNNAERYFITLFMENTRFDAVEHLLQQCDAIEYAYKTTGEGCYHLVYVASDAQDLEAFLNSLLPYARYRVSSAIRCIK